MADTINEALRMHPFALRSACPCATQTIFIADNRAHLRWEFWALLGFDHKKTHCPFLPVAKAMIYKRKFTSNVTDDLETHPAAGGNGERLYPSNG